MNTLSIAALTLVLPMGFLAGRNLAGSAPAALQPGHTPVAAAEAAPSGTYQVDPSHSGVHFNIVHADAGRFWGRFNSVTGEFVIDAAKPDNSRILAVVAAESVDTNSDDRDQHLRSPDFFNAKEFPEIIFESTKVSAAKDGLKVAGNLTLLGKTRPIEVEAQFIGTSEGERFGRRAGYEVRFGFKRSDFGMAYMQGAGLGDEVNVVVSLEGTLEQK